MPARIPAVASLRRRDYAFLVGRLLPRRHLSATRNAQLEAAVRSADRTALHAASLGALTDLASLGLYTELPSVDPERRVFASTSTGDRIHLARHGGAEQQASRPIRKTVTQDPPRAQTRDAATDLGAGSSRSQGELGGMANRAGEADELLLAEELLEVEAESPDPSTPSPSLGMPPPETHDAMGESTQNETTATLDRLDGILDLAGIDTRLTNLAERLRGMLVQLGALLPGTQLQLYHLEGAAEAGELGDGAVRLLSQGELESTPHFRAAIQQHAVQYATTAPEGKEPGVGRVAAVLPLRVGETSWGLLEITWQGAHSGAIRSAMPLLGHVGRLVELAIQNQQTLERLVFIDPLTGVYSRAFYERQLALEMERAHRTNRKFALLVMDVDDFKRINDRYGHRAGDQILAAFAALVRDRMRKIDLMFRYGGEEFVLLLPGAEVEEARRTAERLRTIVAESQFPAEGVPTALAVTVSVGYAIYPDDARTATGLFRHADSALYQAKARGKNRVMGRSSS